jgi:peptide deformylase
MIREILNYKDPEAIQLRVVSQDVNDIDSVKELIEDMKDTLLKNNENGLGLAAPQVGVNLNIIVVRTGVNSHRSPLVAKPIEAMINPKIIKRYPGMGFYREGCMSIPGKTCVVERYKDIKVKYINESGRKIEMRFSGIDAVILQHEIDHLSGTLSIDKAKSIIADPVEKTLEEKLDTPAPDSEAAKENN